MRLGTISLAVAAIVATGCTRREHTRSDFGVANRTFFDRQAKASEQGSALQGLDSDEASAIHQQYREGRGKRGAAVRDPKSSVLILQEGRHEEPKRRP